MLGIWGKPQLRKMCLYGILGDDIRVYHFQGGEATEFK
jgi:hypothetical protein